MDKKLKELIKNKKISDKDLLAFAEAFTVASLDTDQNPNVDAEDVAAETATDNTFTMAEMDARIAKAIADDRKTAAKEQPELGPTKLENDRAEPRYRVLKMK